MAMGSEQNGIPLLSLSSQRADVSSSGVDEISSPSLTSFSPPSANRPDRVTETNDSLKLTDAREEMDEENGLHSENAPFLPRTDSPPFSSTNANESRPLVQKVSNVFRITIAISVLIFILESASSTPLAPRMVIFEDIICRNYYDNWSNNVALGDCKIQPVQAELSFVNGWKDTFEIIPCLLVSIPYGALADRIGRKSVLALALLGSTLSDAWVATVCLFPQIFPLRAIWLSGLCQLVGGGSAMVLSMCYIIIGDVSTQEERITSFSILHGAFLLSDFVSVPLGSSLISVSPWIPVFSGVALMVLTIVLAVIIVPDLRPSHMNPLPARSDSFLRHSRLRPSKEMSTMLIQVFSNLTDTTQWITKDIPLLLMAFLLCQLGRYVGVILLQYTSEKFDWEYSKASYLVSLRAGVNFFVLFVLLPAVLRFFIKGRGYSQLHAEKYATMLSGACLILGSLAIFLAWKPYIVILGQIFFAVGASFTVTARSIITAVVDPKRLGVALTSITAMTYIGVMIGGPMLSSAFNLGLYMGKFWTGLPFLITAMLFGIATFSISLVSTPLI